MMVIPFILAVAAIGKALDDHDENMNWFDLVLNLTEVLGVPRGVEKINDVYSMERQVKIDA
jgi:hypothetical protein